MRAYSHAIEAPQAILMPRDTGKWDRTKLILPEAHSCAVRACGDQRRRLGKTSSWSRAKQMLTWKAIHNETLTMLRTA
ncbi:MAG: hypothetical protein ACJASD_002012 [Sphingomonas echinoides]|jgi:hypothetical protein